MIDIISEGFKWFSSDENSSYQKYMAKLKEQQNELDKGQNYNSAFDTLIQLAGTYQDIGTQIKQIQSDIESANYYLGRYNDEYNLEMAKHDNAIATLKENWASASRSYTSSLTSAQNAIGLTEQSYNNTLFGLESNITSLQNWLGGYDDRYSLAMNSMFQGSIGTLRQMQQGLAQQQVVMAARGQGGATSRLLSQMQQQEIYNFAGRDMTLDAEGGLYGQQYREQRTQLEEELRQNQDKLKQVQADKSLTEAERDEKLRQLNESIDTLKEEQKSSEAQYQRNLSIAEGDKREASLDMEAKRQTVLNNLDISNDAIDQLTNAKQLYFNSFNEALASTIKAGHYAGQTYNDLSAKIDELKPFLEMSDEDFEKAKLNVLEQWKPIDFEIRQDWYTYDMSDENSHISDYVTNIYDKATGQLATQEQLENILRTYAGNLKEKDWYGNKNYRAIQEGVASQGLSKKALEAIIKNSNYNKRKDYK